VTKVLYVEHNDDNLYMLKTRLELLGHFEVLATADSEKGCKLAVTERPDVILMDLEMPVMDRWEPVIPILRLSDRLLPNRVARWT
jgi:two-component system cell cycle response regulator DivK